MSDADYLDVLEDIDSGDYEVSEWEATFIEDMLKNRPYALTGKQQDIVKGMAYKYLGEVLE